jgi:dolichyl-phosphate-mannose--protein O-mannosyl transferase
MPAAMRQLLWIPLVQVGLLLGIVVFAVLAWRRSYGRLAGRLHYSVFALGALAWIFFLGHDHLLWPVS